MKRIWGTEHRRGVQQDHWQEQRAGVPCSGEFGRWLQVSQVGRLERVEGRHNQQCPPPLGKGMHVMGVPFLGSQDGGCPLKKIRVQFNLSEIV